MAKDLECPYCGAELNIKHDDGFGYEEDILHEMQCSECEKYFVFLTSVIYCYSPSKADCLNDDNHDNHDWKPTHTAPKEYTRMECSMCGERRLPTEEERLKYNI